MPKFERHRQV